MYRGTDVQRYRGTEVQYLPVLARLRRALASPLSWAHLPSPSSTLVMVCASTAVRESLATLSLSPRLS